MTDKGYQAALECQIEFLNTCDCVIVGRNEKNQEFKTYVREEELSWYLNEHYPNKNFMVMSVEKLNSAEIPKIAKQITDDFVKRQYGYAVGGK